MTINFIISILTFKYIIFFLIISSHKDDHKNSHERIKNTKKISRQQKSLLFSILVEKTL